MSDSEISGLWDVHAHVLPGVDDGPADLNETVETLRVAYGGGTRRVVATSHMFLRSLHTPEDRLREVFEETVEELERLSRERHDSAFLAEMEFSLGAENYLSTEFLVALEQGQVLTLGGGGCLLVEFNPFLSFEIMKSALQKVLDSGLTPVLAHVERYSIFQRSTARLEEVVELGCHAQINAESVLGSFTSSRRRRSLDLLKSGAVTIVASDMHNAGSRPSLLGEAAKVLAKRFSPAQVNQWMVDNPRLVLTTPAPSSS